MDSKCDEYVIHPNAISDQSHRGILTDKDLGPVLYYHFYPLSLKQSGGSEGNSGYQFGWNQLDFSSGWPVVKAT